MDYTCVVIDDDISNVELLCEYIQEFPGLRVLESFTSPLIALTWLGQRTRPVDIMFTDIEMPGMSGFQLADAARTKYEKLVFVTGHDKYLIDGYNYNASNFILKPFDYSKFNNVSEQLVTNPDENTPHLFLHCGRNESLNRVYIDDILAITALGNYSVVITEDKNLTVYKGISEFEKELCQYPNLVRIHRSTIVSKKDGTSIGNNNVCIGETAYPIGRKYRAMVKRLFD